MPPGQSRVAHGRVGTRAAPESPTDAAREEQDGLPGFAVDARWFIRLLTRGMEGEYPGGHVQDCDELFP